MAEHQQVAYKELMVWQKSMDLATKVIQIIDGLNTDRRHYRLIEQLESNVTSIPMNIAEGMQSTPLGRAGNLKKNLFDFFIFQEARSMKR